MHVCHVLKEISEMKRTWRATKLKWQENEGKLKGTWRENDRNMKRNKGPWKEHAGHSRKSFFPSMETVWYCMASAFLWWAFSDAGFVYIHIAMAPYSDGAWLRHIAIYAQYFKTTIKLRRCVANPPILSLFVVLKRRFSHLRSFAPALYVNCDSWLVWND